MLSRGSPAVCIVPLVGTSVNGGFPPYRFGPERWKRRRYPVPFPSTEPLTDVSEPQMNVAMTGMATRLAATKPSRSTVGNRAARAEVAARATPTRTKSHVPLESMLAVSSRRTAVVIPASAIEIRMAFPIGCVAQRSNASSEVVISRGCRQNTAQALAGGSSATIAVNDFGGQEFLGGRSVWFLAR